MKKSAVYLLLSTFITGTILTSCNSVKNANNTQKGASIGVAAGAVIGGVLGNNLGNKKNSALGAVIGGAVGGTIGGVIGNKMDKQATQISEAVPGAEVERVGEGIRLVLGENAIRFETGKSTLTQSAKDNLDKLIPVFKEYPDTNISIYGYTDNTGNLQSNKTLSEKRADAVKSYLTSKNLSFDRFTTMGMGVEDPIATNDTAEGRTKNRRVEFGITANQNMIKQAEAETKK